MKGAVMEKEELMNLLKFIFAITVPFIKELIQSKVVPTLKRKMYERLDARAEKVINDLAQNAAKIKNEENEVKREAYIEGTKLGLEMLRALADKLNKAADEIDKVIE